MLLATPNYMDIIVQTFWPLKRALRFVKLYKYMYEYVQVCIRGLLVNNVVVQLYMYFGAANLCARVSSVCY